VTALPVAPAALEAAPVVTLEGSQPPV
jgi:hypothetical protein